MPIRLNKKEKVFIGGLPFADITKTVYPFAIKQNVSATKKMVSNNYPGDNMGYIYFNNCSSLNATVYCQQTVIETGLYIYLTINVWDTNTISPIHNVIKYEPILIMPNSPDGLKSQSFIINNTFSNISKNNTVGLFIYAYNETATDYNSFDLGYLEKNS